MKVQEQKIIQDSRPPVVAILGHIDHGKSTLLDYIRKTNVTAMEAGGITQHGSAYEITRPLPDGEEKRITFIDTPGHEAFESIRTRCTNIADMAVLVVSAEDGVRPQTLEVMNHVKECNMPYLVAITKIDKPSADILRTKQNLAENEIYVEGYGGDIPVVELSAISGKGVEEFLDMISLMSELDAKPADRESLGSGVIIESRLDAKRGITAVGIIKDGTVRRGLFAAARAGQAAAGGLHRLGGGTFAPIRFILDGEGNTVEELSFSSPIQIVGWDKMPAIGAEFKTFLKKEEALKYSLDESSVTKKVENAVTDASDLSLLPLVIKTDTAGSLEVIKNELAKLARERIAPKIIASSVGTINEKDVKSALATTGAVIIGFNTKVDSQATQLAERFGIPILPFNIIYELTDTVKKLLSEKEPKIEVKEIEGSAKVIKLFATVKGKQVLGGRVISGLLKRGASITIIRREAELGPGRVRELQQSKIDTDSVNEGNEFGAMIESKIDVAPGDTLQASVMVTK